MDLKVHLRGRNLKWNWDSISKYCVDHPKSIHQILDYCVDKEVILQQNAGAVLGKIIDLDKQVLIQHLPQMMENLKLEPHAAVKRATMRVMQFIEISEEVEGEVFDVAMRYLRSADEPIAVKAFAMTAARKICQRYPELANELIPIIEVLVEQKVSSGILNRGQKELRILRKL